MSKELKKARRSEIRQREENLKIRKERKRGGKGKKQICRTQSLINPRRPKAVLGSKTSLLLK